MPHACVAYTMTSFAYRFAFAAWIWCAPRQQPTTICPTIRRRNDEIFTFDAIRSSRRRHTREKWERDIWLTECQRCAEIKTERDCHSGSNRICVIWWKCFQIEFPVSPAQRSTVTIELESRIFGGESGCRRNSFRIFFFPFFGNTEGHLICILAVIRTLDRSKRHRASAKSIFIFPLNGYIYQI